MSIQKYLQLSPSVREALAAQQPVVALESTIIAHGMPYPQNLETALRMENAVRESGAIPATIAILGGKIRVGLDAADLEYLAKTGHQIPKASRRDLPFLLSQGANGATTVASTMIGADLAGIQIFATGGIGGVHRGAAQSMDISADLQELARTSVAVVCAGAKSILDIGLTLEYLETQGVPVLGYQTNEFPAFYTRNSGFGVDYRVDTPEILAEMLEAKWVTGLQGGVVIANPIPEQVAADGLAIEHATTLALQEADEQGIRGKAITPFLLARIAALTGGKSLGANIELALNNARLAAQLAVCYSRRVQGH
ncbi:MAG: pseudouridine-5'-phosphate glycosidase [Saprospiraceae bacterium]|nr:pseudouridine-5'-phosphate glycosidase [Saprospiraceae bacterium]